MSGRVLVLGSTGRFGAAACEAFRVAGWGVTAQVRPGAAARAPRGAEILETLDRTAVVGAARGTDVVVHALNPRLTSWHKLALPMAYSAIDAAEAAGATLMFPGNVYNYGSGMPAVLDETTPMRPSSRKGMLRVEIKQRMREAAERGVRTIVVRAGDFFGGGRGSWFDLVIAKDFNRGRITYPGPLDVVHEWAYLPDLVAAFVQLAAARDKLGAFEIFGFPGHAVTGHAFAVAISRPAADRADEPGAERVGLSLAGAARHRRRQAQIGHRRGPAHAIRYRGSTSAARPWHFSLTRKRHIAKVSRIS